MSDLENDLEMKYKAQAELSFGFALSSGAFVAAYLQEWRHVCLILVVGVVSQLLRPKGTRLQRGF